MNQSCGSSRRGAFAMVLLLPLLSGCGKHHSPIAPVSPKWVATAGPFAAEVFKLVVPSASVLVAATPAGLMRSTDGGQTWSVTYDRGEDPYALQNSGLATDGAGLCLAATSAGIVRSGDGGLHWSVASQDAAITLATVLVIAPGGDVFAARGAHVLRSQDHGSTWQDITGSLTVSSIPSLAWHPPGLLLAGTNLGVYRTSISSIDWVQVNSGLQWGGSHDAWAVASDGIGTLLASTTGGLHRSTDNGDNWTMITPTPGFCLAHRPAGDWYEGTYGAGIGVSRDDGLHWTTTGVTDISVYSLAADPAGSVYAGIRGSGLRATTDAGVSWSTPSPGPSSSSIRGLVVTASGALVAGALPGGLFRSVDDGAHWSRVGPAPGYSLGYIETIVSDTTGRLRALDPGYNGIFTSTDDGSTWSLTHVPFSVEGAVALAEARNDTLYVATGQGVARSTDHGASWQYTTLSGVLARGVALDAMGAVYAVGAFTGVQRSTDGGATWTTPGGLTVQGWSVLVAPSQEIFVGGLDAQVWRSLDGSHWSPIANSYGIGGPSRLSLVRAGGRTALYAVGPGGVYRLDGSSWTSLRSNLPTPNVLSVAGLSDGTLFVGTAGFGVYRRDP